MKIPNFSKTAVRSDDRTLSYVELNQRADKLAAHLRQLGAGPETLIGLCFTRSIPLVVGAVGIMKSGAAYLPCDPSTPPDRIEVMLKDSETRIVVASGPVAELLPKGNWQVVTLDCDGDGVGFPEAVDIDIEFPKD